MNVAADALSAKTLSAKTLSADPLRADTLSMEGAGTGTEGKPTPDELGIDVSRLVWQRSGDDAGSIEIAFPLSAAWTRGDWVLMRVAGDAAGRILVFDRNEWDCFLDGVRNGEFDDATTLGESDS